MLRRIMAALITYVCVITGITGGINNNIVIKSVKEAYCNILYKEYQEEKGRDDCAELEDIEESTEQAD